MAIRKHFESATKAEVVLTLLADDPVEFPNAALPYTSRSVPMARERVSRYLSGSGFDVLTSIALEASACQTYYKLVTMFIRFMMRELNWQRGSCRN